MSLSRKSAVAAFVTLLAVATPALAQTGGGNDAGGGSSSGGTDSTGSPQTGGSSGPNNPTGAEVGTPNAPPANEGTNTNTSRQPCPPGAANCPQPQ